MAGFGSSIKLNGESEYRRALNQINQSLKEVGSEMKVVSASFDKNDKSSQAMAQKTDILNKKLEEQKNKLSILTQKYNEMNNTYGKNSTAQKELTAQLTKEKAKLDEIGSTLGKTSKEYQNQQKIIDSLEDKQVQYNNAVSKAKTEMNLAQAEINKTTKELDELGKEAENTTSGGLTSFTVAIGNLVSNVISKAISTLKDFAKETLQVGMNFEVAMSKVQAISGVTGEGLEKLRQKAKEMGSTTKFTATESANAFEYMAMAGWKTEDMLNGIEGIMNLASASGEDLATTSDIVTDALTAMGYSAGDAGRLADVMAAASSNANTNVGLMGATFKYAAPIVGALGYSMEDTAVAIGLMANAGIKGEQAGTSLRATLTRLSAPPKECAEAMTALGISITETDGTMKPLSKVIDELRVAFDNLGETQKTEYAKNIAGQQAMSGLLAIVNAAPSDYKKLQKAVESSNGAAKEMSDIMLDNAQGGMTLLKSKLEGIQIEISEKFAPTIEKGIKVLDKLLDGLQWIIDHSSQIAAGLKIMASAVASYVAYTTAIKVMKDGWTSLAIVQKAVTASQWLMNAAMTATPIGIIIAGITALVVGFMHLWKTSESFRNFWIGLWENIKTVFSTVWESIINFFTVTIPEVFNNVLTTIGTWKDNIISFFSELPGKIWEIVQNVITFLQELPYNLGLIIGEIIGNVINFYATIWNFIITKVPEIISTIVNFIAELPGKIWDWLVNAFTKISEWGTNVKNKAIEVGKDFVNNIINFFKNLPSNLWNLLNQTIDKVKTFTKNMVSKAKEGAKNTYDAIVNGIKNLPNSMANIGKNIVEGLWNGIKGMGNWITDKVKGFAKGILDGMKKALGIHSPSRVFKEVVGKNIALGIGEGFTDEMKNVTADMNDAIPTNFDINGSYNGLNSSSGINTLPNYNLLVEAFTNALGGMKIQLDDEEVGSFVKKTVEDAIYS